MPDLEAVRDLRIKLIADVDLIAIVPASDVKTGWKQEFKSFPCVVISQAGGNAVGLIGVGTGAVGTRNAKESIIFQIDIYSRKNRRQTLEICGILSKIMLAMGYAKGADRDDWSTELESYVKTTTWKTNDVYSF